MIFAAKNLPLYGIGHDLPCYKIYRKIPRSLCWITRAYPMEPVPLLHPIISAFRPQLQCQALWVDSPLRTVYQEPRWLVGQLHKAQNLSNDDTEHHGTTSHRTFKDGNNKKVRSRRRQPPAALPFQQGFVEVKGMEQCQNYRRKGLVWPCQQIGQLNGCFFHRRNSANHIPLKYH